MTILDEVIHNVNDVGYHMILSCGQSGEAGRGNPVDLVRFDGPDNRVHQYGNPASAPAGYGNVISLAVEPLYHADAISPTAGIGHVAHMAKRMLHRTPPNRRILIVPAAYGGTAMHTSTQSWDPAKLPGDTANLAAAAVVQANAAWAAAEAEYPGKNRWVGLSFDQGEADAGFMTQAQWGAAFDRFLDYIRANVTGFGNAPAVIFPLVPEWIPTTTGADLIRAAHIDTPYRKLRTAYVDGVVGDPNGTPPSLIHAGSTAQRKLGALGANALLRAQANVTGTPPVAPGVPTLTQSGFSVLATWPMPTCRVTDFLQEYKINGGAWTTLAHARSLDNNATVTGGAAGDTVQVRTSTVNEQGTSAPTAPVSITLTDVPAALSGLTAGAVTVAAVSASWSASARATFYLCEYRLAGSGSYSTFGTVTGTSVTIGGLIASTAYDFRITPKNAAGGGTAGTLPNVTTAAPTTIAADVGVTPAAAWGFRRLVTGYAGHALDVRYTDATTGSIDYLANGDLDTTALLAGAAAHGGDAWVTKLYDQSGNGRHGTQATTTKQVPVVTANALAATLGGKPATPVVSGDYYDIGAPFLYAAGAATHLAVCQATTLPSAMALYAEGHSTGTPQARYLLDVSTGIVLGSLIRGDDNANFLSSAGTLPISGAGAHHCSHVDTGSLMTYGVDGTFNTGTAYSRAGKTLTLDRAALFAQPATTYTFFFVGTWCETVIWSAALTPTQEAAGRANHKAYYSIP